MARAIIGALSIAGFAIVNGRSKHSQAHYFRIAPISGRRLMGDRELFALGALQGVEGYSLIIQKDGDNCARKNFHMGRKRSGKAAIDLVLSSL